MTGPVKHLPCLQRLNDYPSSLRLELLAKTEPTTWLDGELSARGPTHLDIFPRINTIVKPCKKQCYPTVLATSTGTSCPFPTARKRRQEEALCNKLHMCKTTSCSTTCDIASSMFGTLSSQRLQCNFSASRAQFNILDSPVESRGKC